MRLEIKERSELKFCNWFCKNGKTLSCRGEPQIYFETLMFYAFVTVAMCIVMLYLRFSQTSAKNHVKLASFRFLNKLNYVC